MKGYSTKYALTTGIQEVEVELPLSGEDTYVYTVGRWKTQLRVGRDFFASVEAAESNARERARKKIASLQKSLKKIRKLANTPKWAAEKDS